VGKERTATAVGNSLILFYADFVEIRDLEKDGELKQIIAGENIRCLDNAQGGFGKRNVIIVMAHTDFNDRQLVLELVPKSSEGTTDPDVNVSSRRDSSWLSKDQLSELRNRRAEDFEGNWQQHEQELERGKMQGTSAYGNISKTDTWRGSEQDRREIGYLVGNLDAANDPGLEQRKTGDTSGEFDDNAA
jgi:hypothetical protein